MAESIPAPSALLKADTATLTFRAEKDGPLRVVYGNWDGYKVFRPGESIELVARGGQVQAFRRGVPTPQVDPLVDHYRDWDMGDSATDRPPL
jgi:hypothetical protein